jgi:hypothetical protein
VTKPAEIAGTIDNGVPVDQTCESGIVHGGSELFVLAYVIRDLGRRYELVVELAKSHLVTFGCIVIENDVALLDQFESRGTKVDGLECLFHGGFPCVLEFLEHQIRIISFRLRRIAVTRFDDPAVRADDNRIVLIGPLDLGACVRNGFDI